MNKKIIIPLILVILFAGQQININAADSAIIEVSAESIYLTAGEKNSIEVKLRNTGDYKVYDIEAFLTSSTTSIHVLEDGHKVYSEIGKDKTKRYEPVLYVDEDQALGSYTLPLTIVYRRFGAAQDTTVTVPLVIIVNEGYVPKIGFTTDQSNLRLKSGTEQQLGLSFTNRWTEEIQDLTFSASCSDTNIILVDGITTTYSSVNISEVVSISPMVSVIEGTAIGTYSIMIYASYNDANGNSYYQTFTVPLRLDETSAGQTTTVTIHEVKTAQASVKPGDMFEIDVDVVCSGANAYDVLSVLGLSITSPLSPVTPTTVSLGDIDEDGKVTAKYTLLVSGDTAAGQYPVTLILSYTDSVAATRTLSETITIMVDGLIEFELLDIPSISAYKGEVTELEADILLIGTENVQFVSIELVENSVFERVQGSTEYIGAVDPDSPIPFDVQYKVAEDAEEGKHELELLVNYRDHLNKPHEVTLKTVVDVGLQNPAENETKKGGFWNWLRSLFG